MSTAIPNVPHRLEHGSQRERVFKIRLTAAELERIREAAKNHDMSAAQFARAALLGAIVVNSSE